MITTGEDARASTDSVCSITIFRIRVCVMQKQKREENSSSSSRGFVRRHETGKSMYVRAPFVKDNRGREEGEEKTEREKYVLCVDGSAFFFRVSTRTLNRTTQCGEKSVMKIKYLRKVYGSTDRPWKKTRYFIVALERNALSRYLPPLLLSPNGLRLFFLSCSVFLFSSPSSLLVLLFSHVYSKSKLQ